MESLVFRRDRAVGLPASLTVLLLLVTLGGCASRPINEPIEAVDPTAGYRPHLLINQRSNQDPRTLFVLSFSGGGTRAAAFSYGLLKALRDTEIEVDGQRRRMLDEVDVITGVSGGSFTALAYALYGEQLFEEYETRFLRRNVQGDLFKRALNPFNWHKYIGGTAGRSELAAEYYDEILFEGATFADLAGRSTPVALATGTDISTGARIAFFQEDFDIICSDLDKVRLSRAAATSSAVPVVLSPVTFNNFAGSCGYQYPKWVVALTDGSLTRPSGRALLRLRDIRDLQDSESRPYIHLVDGGVTDNIGVRGVLEALQELAASAAFSEERGFDQIRRVVLIVVNAHSSPDTTWDQSEKPPGFFSQLLQSSGVPIDRYSYETIETMKDMAEIWRVRRELRVAEAQLAGSSREAAEAANPKIGFHAFDVSFDAVKDSVLREYFLNLPTSFFLPGDEIDRLIDLPSTLLSESQEYRALVRDFGGELSE